MVGAGEGTTVGVSVDEGGTVGVSVGAVVGAELGAVGLVDGASVGSVLGVWDFTGSMVGAGEGTTVEPSSIEIVTDPVHIAVPVSTLATMYTVHVFSSSVDTS